MNFVYTHLNVSNILQTRTIMIPILWLENQILGRLNNLIKITHWERTLNPGYLAIFFIDVVFVQVIFILFLPSSRENKEKTFSLFCLIYADNICDKNSHLS